MCPEASHEITVAAKNSASGNLTGGRRILSAESNKAARASPSRMCDAAMENRMEMMEPQVR
jgi:hypothetical protein